MRRHARQSQVEEPNNDIIAGFLTGFTSDFLSFIVVELIRFFHRAHKLSVIMHQLLILLSLCHQLCQHLPSLNIVHHALYPFDVVLYYSGYFILQGQEATLIR